MVIARIWPSTTSPDDTQSDSLVVRVYQYDSESDSFLRRTQFARGTAEPPQRLVGSNDVTTIVFAYTYNSREIRNGFRDWVARRVYNSNGEVRKKWYISDLLDRDQIGACTVHGFAHDGLRTCPLAKMERSSTSMGRIHCPIGYHTAGLSVSIWRPIASPRQYSETNQVAVTVRREGHGAVPTMNEERRPGAFKGEGNFAPRAYVRRNFGDATQLSGFPRLPIFSQTYISASTRSAEQRWRCTGIMIRLALSYPRRTRMMSTIFSASPGDRWTNQPGCRINSTAGMTRPPDGGSAKIRLGSRRGTRIWTGMGGCAGVNRGGLRRGQIRFFG